MLKRITLIFLFLLTFTARLYMLDNAPLYPDEITWIVRAKETALAIRTGNFSYFDNAWWNIKNDTEAIALPLTISTGFPIIYLAYDASVLSANLFKDYVVGRVVVITLTSIFIVLFYLGVEKLFNKRVAFWSSFLLTLDPIFIANSRMVMNDIYLTIFVALSFLFFLVIKNIKSSSFLAGFFAAMAFLTKPLGLVLLPIFLLIKDKKRFIFTGIYLLLFILLFWPNSWNSPVISIFEYLVRQKSLADAGINNYFFGQITENPSLFYYPFQMLIRLPLTTIIGLISSVYILLIGKGNKKIRFILFFIILYCVVVSFSPKKLGIRYLLPIYPFVYILVGNFFSKINIKINFILIVFTIFNYFNFSPNFEHYYNGLIKQENIKKFDLVGLCQGSKDAVDYILKCYPNVQSIGAVGCGNSTIPYYYPYHFDSNWENKDIFFVESYYIQLEKDMKLNEFVNNNSPTKEIKVNNLNLANIYAKKGVIDICD